MHSRGATAVARNQIGSLVTASSLGIRLSPLGAIPKKGKPDKWRLIMDLSSPDGFSVNDEIPKEDCLFHYALVDLAVERIIQLGSGVLMGKMDILLGLEWQSQVYVDEALPFGLHSAPVIFSAVADALTWIMSRRGLTWAIHYVDDFLTVGGPSSEEC